MSDWTDLRDKVIGGVTAQDVRVYVKTNLGREVLVYDSGNPQVADKGGDSFIKYGVKVKNQNDVEVFSYGSYPDTNYFLVSGMAAAGLFSIFVLVKGLKGTFK